MNNRAEILDKVNKLVYAYKTGLLGGEKMPEDENPHLDKGCKENYMYFTLPMALNYQRNSYVLWECANRMHADELVRKIFDSREVCLMSEEYLRDQLVKYKVALQPNKQPLIWKRICETVEERLEHLKSVPEEFFWICNQETLRCPHVGRGKKKRMAELDAVRKSLTEKEINKKYKGFDRLYLKGLVPNDILRELYDKGELGLIVVDEFHSLGRKI